MAPPNPPRPPGLRPARTATKGMQEWAKTIVYDSATYPMHSVSVNLVDGKLLAARVEWHSWSTKGQHGQGGDPNEKIQGTFRGATLYEIVDPNAFGEYLYQQQGGMAVSGESIMRRPVPMPQHPRTVTDHAEAAVRLAVKPVKWTVHTAGSIVNWLGHTLQSVGNKL